MPMLLLSIAILCLTVSKLSFAQSYNISVANGIKADDYNFEFDIIISGVSGNIELTSCQGSLIFNRDIGNGGMLEFTYINGTSDLSSPPETAEGIYFLDREKAILTFASLPGSSIVAETELRVGRFLLKNTRPFSKTKIDISWNFNGNTATILTGIDFSDITSLGNFYSAGNNINNQNNLDKSSDSVKTKSGLTTFELFPNYPNPFNPSTTIKFSIPQSSFVQIKVFNIIGEEVKRLVNETLQEGAYEVLFNAESLPSGYYIYSFYADNKIIEYRKMILVK